MKACVITKKSQSDLASRFGIIQEDVDALLPIGYWCVTDFGNDETFQVLTEQNFNSEFSQGANLLNGWVDITAKET